MKNNVKRNVKKRQNLWTICNIIINIIAINTFDLSVSDSKYEWFPYGTRRYLESKESSFEKKYIYSSTVRE